MQWMPQLNGDSYDTMVQCACSKLPRAMVRCARNNGQRRFTCGLMLRPEVTSVKGRDWSSAASGTNGGSGPGTLISLRLARTRHAQSEWPLWAQSDALRRDEARTASIPQWCMKCPLLGIKVQVANTSSASASNSGLHIDLSLPVGIRHEP
jgi:hypothetical protein